MRSPHIAFVGLMGSGKSTVGVLVAKRLKLRFVDLDAAVEAKHGAIATIFASLGEAAFRAFEYEALREAISAERAIISTGGGIVTHEPSRRLLAEMTTVYLEASVECIVRRLSASSVLRPLVGAAPTCAQVRQIFQARRRHYEAATFRVNAEESTDRVVARVLRLLRGVRGSR